MLEGVSGILKIALITLGALVVSMGGETLCAHQMEHSSVQPQVVPSLGIVLGPGVATVVAARGRSVGLTDTRPLQQTEGPVAHTLTTTRTAQLQAVLSL